ncbi:AbrB/MazE/SpoVT family DNA-binding domain-containing protein [Bradyrhizobium sp. WSM3983]|uniref:AbrB/MazE/SpoVT family DNA-binding domain-containing protein n=1 Tax=Bradyrhizobium sp. WSM3983 TaxID=1038867 RepID=UPI0012EC9726|nr:AbrB/MazE/SpoVT family DNA-binding domain-containing protein [Bradyrhizobium sp. WSM3983]
MVVVLKVFKWNDDLAVELPQELINQLALKEGDELEIVAATEAPGARAEVLINKEQDELRPNTR